MNKVNYITFKLLLFIILFNPSFSQTGLFLPKGETGFSVWGKNLFYTDCSSCNSPKILSFDYLAPYDIELSVGKLTFQDNYDYSYYQITKYIRLNDNSFSFWYRGNRIEDVDSRIFGFRLFDSSGFTIEVFNWIEDNENFYREWNEQFIVLGKYFSYKSYVLGIEYINTIDNLDEFDDAAIMVSFGSLFK